MTPLRPPPDGEGGGRARRNGHPADAVDVMVTAIEIAPAPPPGLNSANQDDWLELWSSPMRKTISTTDLPALRRLFTLRNLSDQLHQELAHNPTVPGSQDQPVANPAGKMAIAVDGEIRQLEDRFGFTPKARLHIGVRIGDVAEAMKRNPEAFGHEPQEDSRRADPRVADAIPAASEPRGRRR